MAATVEQIRRELNALSEATATLSEEFKELYKHYLQALGKAVRQQLILASYHLCTQAYPDAFLNLSVAQRQKLQVALRELGDEAQEHLQASLQVWQASPMEWLEQYLTQELSSPEEPSSEPAEDASASERTLSDDTLSDDIDTEISPTADTSQPPEAAADLEGANAASGSVATPDMIAKAAAAALRQIREETGASAATGAPSAETKEPLTPARLAKQHLHLEQHIRTVLQGINKTANFLLKKEGILPDLPEVVLAAAAESTAMDRGPSPPNLLNVLVEMRDRISEDRISEDHSDIDLDQELDQQDEEEDAADHDDQDDSRVTHLIAIHLQLSDIEFADPQTSLWRSRLREALANLKKLGNQYQKKQREQAIAEAEAAWRAIWYND